MALGSQINKFIPVLTDLEVASQYILKIKFCVYVKLIVSVANTDAEKNCSRIMFVVLTKKQSEKTLKLLVDFQMMKKFSFFMN